MAAVKVATAATGVEAMEAEVRVAAERVAAAMAVAATGVGAPAGATEVVVRVAAEKEPRTLSMPGQER